MLATSSCSEIECFDPPHSIYILHILKVNNNELVLKPPEVGARDNFTIREDYDLGWSESFDRVYIKLVQVLQHPSKFYCMNTE